MAKKACKTDVSEETIIRTEFSDEMKQSYINYAVSVITERALPDVRDGLKPVHRRILHEMYTNERLTFDKPFKKCAGVVGTTLAKYHPHGDQSVYDALVRLAQPFQMNLPLVDGHGNFGSIDGDPPAAMRYTECRLSQITSELIAPTTEDVVPMVRNFDNTRNEPTVLPMLFPGLLVNGTSGIAVGISSYIPPHNLRELIDAIVAWIDNNNISDEKLFSMLKGPDFPTGGIIANGSSLIEMYREQQGPTRPGSGKIIVRARYNIEVGPNGKTNIVVTEIPYSYSGRKEALLESIINLVTTKKLAVTDVRDESSSDVRIVVECKKEANVDNIVALLHAKGPLEDSISVKMIALKEKETVYLSLRGYIKEFVEFQRAILTSIYRTDLKKRLQRKEILEGLKIALDCVDVIIEVSRYSAKESDSKNCLMNGDISGIDFKTKKYSAIAKRFCFSEVQAEAILDITMRQLSKIKISSVEKEYEAVSKDIESITNNLQNIDRIVKKQLRDIAKKYGSPRKTDICDSEAFSFKEEDSEKLDVFVCVDKLGYVKLVDSEISAEDVRVFKADTSQKIAVFQGNGSVSFIRCKDLPMSKPREKGTHINAKLGNSEEILCAGIVGNDDVVVVVLESGLVKVLLPDELNVSRTTVAYTSAKEKVVYAAICKNSDKLNVKSTNKELSLKVSDIPRLKRASAGVKILPLCKCRSSKESFVSML